MPMIMLSRSVEVLFDLLCVRKSLIIQETMQVPFISL